MASQHISLSPASKYLLSLRNHGEGVFPNTAQERRAGFGRTLLFTMGAVVRKDANSRRLPLLRAIHSDKGFPRTTITEASFGKHATAKLEVNTIWLDVNLTRGVCTRASHSLDGKVDCLLRAYSAPRCDSCPVTVDPEFLELGDVVLVFQTWTLKFGL